VVGHKKKEKKKSVFSILAKCRMLNEEGHVTHLSCFRCFHCCCHVIKH